MKDIKELQKELNIPENLFDQFLYSLGTESFSFEDTADTIYDVCVEETGTKYSEFMPEAIKLLKEYDHDHIVEEEIGIEHYRFLFDLKGVTYQFEYDYNSTDEDIHFEYDGTSKTLIKT